VGGVTSVSGGFDSHALPPHFYMNLNRNLQHLLQERQVMAKKRIFSGIQPTGVIHIGNYVGAIRQWVELMEEYECIFSIVDYHAISLEYEVDVFRKNIINAARTLMACGLDLFRSARIEAV
jgi:hypothetical protein